MFSQVLILICLTSVYSEPIMLKPTSMNKEMMPEKLMLDDPVMVETAMAKPKRDSYPYHHSTPCPPYLHSHVNKGWQPSHPQVQFIHQPTVIQKPVIVKPHVPYHQPVMKLFSFFIKKIRACQFFKKPHFSTFQFKKRRRYDANLKMYIFF